MSFGIFDEQTICSRKQSASDLQSRLKTRKLLGVGELAGDNGEIYRSKISQLLGINESLYVKLPKGLLYWNTVNTLYFYLVGALYVILPTLAARLELGITADSNETQFVGRMYGTVLISFGLLFRSIIIQRETRADIANLLLVTAVMHILQLGVITASFNMEPFAALLHAGIVTGNLIYHTFVDVQGGVYRQFLRLVDELSLLATPVIERPERRMETASVPEKTDEPKPEEQKKDE